MAMQLGQIDLLTAMYAHDDAVHIDPPTLDLIETLRAWCEYDHVFLNKIQPSLNILLDSTLR